MISNNGVVALLHHLVGTLVKICHEQQAGSETYTAIEVRTCAVSVSNHASVYGLYMYYSMIKEN